MLKKESAPSHSSLTSKHACPKVEKTDRKYWQQVCTGSIPRKLNHITKSYAEAPAGSSTQAQAIQHAGRGHKVLLKPRVRRPCALLEISVNTPISMWELSQIPPIPTELPSLPPSLL